MTRRKFPAPPDRAWNSLVFFEQVEGPPPLYLRLLLPVPIGTDAGRPEVGATTLCRYRTGYLSKRITRVERGSRYGFEVVEQNLPIGGGIRISGGGYRLHGLADGRTEVEIETRYVSPRRPRWLWKPIEAAVCHLFHGHLLGAMRRSVEARGGLA